MFSLRTTLKDRKLPQGYDPRMGIVVLCGRRPTSITVLKNSPCPESAIVHFKSLIPITNAVRTFIDAQLTAMQRLFAEGGVAILPGNTEDLSGNAALQTLRSLDVANCLLGQPTKEQDDLFANRNNVGADDLVVYIVQNLINSSGMVSNLLGCATHPAGQPGAAVVLTNDLWLVAHEIGHVLNLRHVGDTQSDSLMFPNVGWTNVPPDIAASEYEIMRGSPLTRACQGE